jgi:hypothetical protein
MSLLPLLSPETCPPVRRLGEWRGPGPGAPLPVRVCRPLTNADPLPLPAGGGSDGALHYGSAPPGRQLSKSPLPPRQPLRLCFECQRPVDSYQDTRNGRLDGFPNPSRLDLREPSACREAAPSGHAQWVYFITEQVYEANPSLGLQCGGPMTVIAVIAHPAAVL